MTALQMASTLSLLSMALGLHASREAVAHPAVQPLLLRLS